MVGKLEKCGVLPVSVLLALVLACALPLRASFAAEADEASSCEHNLRIMAATSLFVANTEAKAGDSVDVDIVLEGNPGILGATFEVNYDSRLTLTDIKNGEAFQQLEMTKPGELKSGCNIHWDAPDLLESDIQDGVIATLTFTVSKNATAGSTCFISVAAAKTDGQPDVFDSELTPIDVASASCNVTVVGEPQVERIDITTATVEIVGGSSLSYTGSPLTPVVRVVLGGTEIPHESYSVEYFDNTEPGLARVEATGFGSYRGTAKGTFEISFSSNAGQGESPSGTSHQAQTQVMHRLYNPNSGEHFYTASAAERDMLRRVGWRYEGEGWKAPTEGADVYRLYNANAGDHHYTTSAAERDMLRRVGWRYEGIGWKSAGADGVPLYRQYNPNAKAGSHNYTTSKGENDMLVRAGWRAEGIGWYGA